MFQGSQKGVAFKDLVCGIVLLTHGKPEEKRKCECREGDTWGGESSAIVCVSTVISVVCCVCVCTCVRVLMCVGGLCVCTCVWVGV